MTAGSPHGPWRLSNSPALAIALPNLAFVTLGLLSLVLRKPNNPPVVLPLPEGPISRVNCLPGSERLTPRRASTRPAPLPNERSRQRRPRARTRRRAKPIACVRFQFRLKRSPSVRIPASLPRLSITGSPLMWCFQHEPDCNEDARFR
jgi:hypothetical protein